MSIRARTAAMQRRRPAPGWTALLNLLLAATLSLLGAVAWLLLFVTGVPRRRRRGHLRLIIDANDGESGRVNLNMRVPLNLLRAGVRLAGLMPGRVKAHVNAALRDRGMDFDVTELRPEDVDEVIDALQDISVDIAQEREDVSVRIAGA